ncbi:ABC transporter ATP-binding protein [Paenibacillus baekrokdamisoli]|uniref:ABC transporter ATP-binding protein n=1 Tax=Paenibacillus baekrokdamisoli TaxID=1712516 RepID=A0A3G9J982_9BACL|nr:ATP-binding cassette domain-containing protein [Paenibacillus baekrokdamisoli]MBB3069521.1 ABC-type multidrug transport system ATPase subunit [Paenibacillus baekrokdamisoli]BBH24905.1 ABC transporter ATP-binding protein [Paenibacillus baekrokdamisoli]
MLTANNLGKKYKHTWALEPISLTLDRGMHGLLGPNGAGKSTLMRLFAGLLVPTTGDAMLHGSSVRSGNQVRQQIGYVPQTFQMFPQLTARQWLLHVARLKNIGTKREREAEAERLLRAVQLESKADLPARSYSTGMVKRLGIAQALVGSPQIIIVDEPTAGLDPEERIRLRNVLVELAQSSVVLFSTHVLSDVDMSCRDVIVLGAGKLHYNGKLEGLAEYASGKLWEWEASEHEWRAIAQEQLLTARRTADGIRCRTIADLPPTPYAAAVVPTMEDGYLALISSLTIGTKR